MAASMASLLFLALSFVSSLQLASASSLCPLQSRLFLSNLQYQCPLSIAPSSVIEVSGESLDKALSKGVCWSRPTALKQLIHKPVTSYGNVYTAVLFHASWCPLSCQARVTFDTLSSKFPQIRHLAVEQSAAMPCVFSIYGVHSLPALLMVNQTAKVWYHGSKDLDSFVQFYKKITGLEPIEYIADNKASSLGNSEKTLLELMDVSSRKEILAREPYLVFAVLFLSLRAFMYICPGILSSLRAFWVLCISHLNPWILGETSQLLGRVVHVTDVKRMWNKVRLCKTRNFHNGAKNARVWASSLASVSLGETSSGRASIGES